MQYVRLFFSFLHNRNGVSVDITPLSAITTTGDFTLELCRFNNEMFLYSPRFELPMGASEQPPLPQQAQNQTKVRGHIQKDPHTCMYV